MKRTWLRLLTSALCLTTIFCLALTSCENEILPGTESPSPTGENPSTEQSTSDCPPMPHEYNEDAAGKWKALISAGKEYTVSVKTGKDEKYLTDGLTNDLQLNTDGVLFCETTGQSFDVTLDLGEVKAGLTQFCVWLMCSSGTSDVLSMQVFTATDDGEYAPATGPILYARRPRTAMGRIYLLNAEINEGIPARYVKFVLTPSESGKVALVEAAVYAEKDNSFIDNVPKPESSYDRAPETIAVPHVKYSMITTMTLSGATEDMAEKYFNTLQEAGIEGVIILHGSDEQGAVYQNSALDHVFKQSKKRGMKVFMGMNSSSDIFGKTEAYLAGNEKAVKALYNEYVAAYPDVICGWYLTQEYSNSDYANHTTDVVHILNAVIDHINAVTPDLPLLMSPYNTSWGGSPEKLGKDLETIFSQTHFRDFDIYCPQDGAGCGYISADSVGAYLEAAQKVCKKHNVQFWVNLENFILDASVPDGQDDIPAPVSRFADQLRTASAYTDTFVTFTYEAYMPEYFSNYTIYNDIPEYHQNYLAYLNTGKALEEKLPEDVSVRVEKDFVTIYLPTPAYRVQAIRVVRGNSECWYNHRLIRTVGGTSYLTIPNDMPNEPFAVTVFDHSARSTGAKRFDKDGTPFKGGGPVDRTKTGTNVALGKTYTATKASHDNKDDGGELTDGKYGRTDFTDPAWQGFNGQVYNLTVDLGEMIDNIGDISLNVLGGGYGAVMEPRSFEVSVSSDGTNYDPVGKVEAADKGTGTPYISKLTLELKEYVSARYVKISVSVLGWLFTDEVEIIVYE